MVLVWAALGCSGLMWAALGCSGLLWAALGCPEQPWRHRAEKHQWYWQWWRRQHEQPWRHRAEKHQWYWGWWCGASVQSLSASIHECHRRLLAYAVGMMPTVPSSGFADAVGTMPTGTSSVGAHPKLLDHCSYSIVQSLLLCTDAHPILYAVLDSHPMLTSPTAC